MTPVPTYAANESKGTTRGRPRVLWVDAGTEDVPHLLDKTYDVHTVADAETALAAAVESPPDVVLVGATRSHEALALLQSLRTQERTALVPVILLLADEDVAVACLDAGADDYLVTPFSKNALLARLRSRLGRAQRQEEASAKLLEAHKELETLSYSVSHDLRAPLRSIDGFSKALAADYADKLDDQARHYLMRVRAGAQRMGQLIDDLLSLSRIARAPMNREQVNLTDISRRILSDLEGKDAGRSVASDIASGLVARGDLCLVTALLEDLLGNAWKFTSKRPDAQIAVGTSQHQGETVFFVRDNGAGFAMEYAGKLFAPFQRLHTEAEFPGTGIGLAKAQRVVARHGGRIWAEALPERGATFFFTLGN